MKSAIINNTSTMKPKPAAKLTWLSCVMYGFEGIPLSFEYLSENLVV